MPNPPWEPLSPDIADWMGMDEAMVPFARDVADPAPEPAPVPSQAPFTTA